MECFTRSRRLALLALAVSLGSLTAYAGEAAPPSEDVIEYELLDDSTAVKSEPAPAVAPRIEERDALDVADQTPAPAAPREERRIISKGRTISGAVLFGVPWILSIVSASIVASTGSSGVGSCSDCQEVSQVLWIPVVGPAMTQVVDDIHGLSPIAPVLFIWSLAQAGGVALFATGLIGSPVHNVYVPPAMLQPFVSRDRVGLKLRLELRGHAPERG